MGTLQACHCGEKKANEHVGHNHRKTGGMHSYFGPHVVQGDGDAQKWHGGKRETTMFESRRMSVSQQLAGPLLSSVIAKTPG